MANRLHIRGAQLVTMDETLGDFAGRRHPDRGRRHPCRRPIARRRRRGDDRRRRHDRAARHHRCPYLPVADRAARLPCPTCGPAPTIRSSCRCAAATRPRTISTPPGSAASRCCPTARPRSSTIATTSAVPAFAPASLAALKETGIRHLFTYSFMPSTPDEFARPEDRLADGRRVYDEFHDPKSLTTIGFGVEFDRRTGPGGSSSPSRAISRRQAASMSTRQAPSTSSRPRACSGLTCW